MQRGFLIGLCYMSKETAIEVVEMIGYLEYKRRKKEQENASFEEFQSMNINLNPMTEYFHDIRIVSNVSKTIETLAFYLGVQVVDLNNMISDEKYYINQETLEIKKFETGRKDPDCNNNFKRMKEFAQIYFDTMFKNFSASQLVFKKEWDYFSDQAKPKLIIMDAERNNAGKDIIERKGHLLELNRDKLDTPEMRFEVIKEFLYDKVKYHKTSKDESK